MTCWFPTRIWKRNHQNNQRLKKKKFLLETIAYGHKTIKRGSDLGKFLRINFSEDIARSIVVLVAAAAGRRWRRNCLALGA